MKKFAIMALLAVAACGICSASVKNIKIYDKANKEIGVHNSVTSLTFANGKLTVNTPIETKAYNLADISELTIPNTQTSVAEEMAVSGFTAVLKGGMLDVKSCETIKKIEVYTVAGELISSIQPDSNEVLLSLNSDSAVIITRVETVSKVSVVKLINR